VEDEKEEERWQRRCSDKAVAVVHGDDSATVKMVRCYQ